MRESHLILSNAAIMWANRFFLLIPQLIFVPYLIRTIGEAGYGVYALVWSLMIAIDQLEKSLQSGVVKYSAGYLAQKRMDEVSRVVSSCSLYSCLLAVVMSAATLAAAFFYKDPSGKIGMAMIIMGIMLLFIIPLTPYIAVIQSMQRYYIGEVSDAVSKYISFLVVVLWFHSVGPSIEALIIIMAVALFFSRLVQVPIAYRLIPGLKNYPSLFSWPNFRLIASFGAATVMTSLCLAANSTGIRWLMDSLASTAFVAHLAIILMPGALLSQLIGAITIPAMPAASAYEATGNKVMLQELMIRGMRYTTILALAALLIAAVLMKNVLSLWVGSEYVFLAPYALTLFAGGAFMMSTSIVHHMLKGMGKLKAVMVIYLIGLVIVPFGLILSLYRISGNPYLAATAGLAAGHLVCGCLNIAFCTKAVYASLREVLFRTYAQPLIVAGAVGISVFGVIRYAGIENMIGRSLLSFLGIVLFFSGCYLFIATNDERRQISELMQLAARKILSFRETAALKFK